MPAEHDASDGVAAIRAQVKRFLLDNSLVPLGDDALTGTFNIIESGVVDSVLILDLVSYLEERCGILLGPDDIVAQNFRDLDSITRLAVRLHRA